MHKASPQKRHVWPAARRAGNRICYAADLVTNLGFLDLFRFDLLTRTNPNNQAAHEEIKEQDGPTDRNDSSNEVISAK